MNTEYLQPNPNERWYIMNNAQCAPVGCDPIRLRMTIKRHKELALLAYNLEEYMNNKLKIKLSSDEICQFGGLMQNLLQVRRDEK